MSDAVVLDREDVLADKRSLFSLPSNTVYLDGNSLGALPTACKQAAQAVVEHQWGDDLITSWNKHQWIDLPSRVGDKIGRLIGAKAGQVVCCDTISTNLFKVLSAAIKMSPERKTIATTKDNFPTDIYMAEGLLSLLGDEYRIQFIDENDVASQLHDDIAVLMLTQVNFRSGRKQDITAVTAAAHEKGILTLWDLAHSAGAFAVHLDEANADFAVGCTYKYLNGGPGSPAFVYVAERHQARYQQPLSGWMGHSTPFAFSHEYTPHDSVKRNLCGTPGVIGMQVLDAALSVFDNTDMALIEDKSAKLQAYFLAKLEAHGLAESFTLASPAAAERGSQLAFSHPEAYAICQAWIDKGVIADFRAPDILRVGFAPLYLRFADIEHAVNELALIVNNKTYLQSQYQVVNDVT